MDTLLIRLVAPLQSWGVQSHYTVRDSALEPSKSGVIGLICAALGRPREAALDDLAGLRMGVRVDREGSLRADYQIAQNVLDADGKKLRASVVTNRYYLADAAFLVGLEGSPGLLRAIEQALRSPVWALYLGRKAFVPAQPVYLRDGYREGQALAQALEAYGWIIRKAGAGADETAANPREKLRAVIEDIHGTIVRPDVPISFARRSFSSRRVSIRFWDAPASLSQEVV